MEDIAKQEQKGRILMLQFSSSDPSENTALL